MCTCHFLSHRGQESLRVEEPGHPEDVWPAVEHPREELGVSVKEVSEPEAKGGRLPRDLDTTTTCVTLVANTLLIRHGI